MITFRGDTLPSGRSGTLGLALTSAAAGAVSAAAGAFGGVTAGDGPADAGVIPAMPFSAAGDIAAFTDQFDVVCPFTGSTSPDAWYQYTASVDEALVIELCESAYDTKVYVLDADLEPVGCNDDGCSDAAGNPFRSSVTVLAEAGTPLFIVVDGFDGDAGAYQLAIESLPPEFCVLTCPDGAISEGEACAPGTPDEVNGGCGGGGPELFIRVACGDVVCASTYAFGGMRDTDWFDFVATEPTVYTMTATTEFPMVLLGIGQTSGCDPLYVYDAQPVLSCTTGSLTLSQATPAGEIGWFVPLIDGFDGYPCDAALPFGNDYVITVSCAAPAPSPCPTLGDANGDGFVDFDDLLRVLANFGPCP